MYNKSAITILYFTIVPSASSSEFSKGAQTVEVEGLPRVGCTTKRWERRREVRSEQHEVYDYSLRAGLEWDDNSTICAHHVTRRRLRTLNLLAILLCIATSRRYLLRAREEYQQLVEHQVVVTACHILQQLTLIEYLVYFRKREISARSGSSIWLRVLDESTYIRSTTLRLVRAHHIFSVFSPLSLGTEVL